MNTDLIKTILANYSIDELISFEKIDKGFSSANYKVVTDEGIFFLKKHRPSGASRLDSIEQAEQFFGTTDIPVVTPIKNSMGKYHAVIEGNYYVLYPFVSGIQYESGIINAEIAANLGTLLAKAHLLSKDGFAGVYIEDTYFKLPPRAEKLAAIDQILSNLQGDTEYDQKAKEGLELKKKLVQNNTNATSVADGSLIYVINAQGGQTSKAPKANTTLRKVINAGCFSTHLRKLILFFL
jgi:Ser/Thr protein kinase RdoA (MazF antagonist)